MHVSYNLLKKFVDLSHISLEEFVSKVTIAGVEIEDVQPLAIGNNLVIGQVVECVNHPQSDHLHVCQVNLGNKIVQIVCGASNVAAGQKVIVAKPGADLKAKGIVIQKSSIRGVESNGMICSLSELGVAKERLNAEQLAGIEVLDASARIGDEDPLAFLGLNDVTLELKPTPNRGDVLSVLSFAKDVAAILNCKMLYQDEKVKQFEELETRLSVTSSTNNCHFFNAQKVNGIHVQESPKWLRETLLASNINPVNNVVDIGNYVMLVYGQPIHIYDADKLDNLKMSIHDHYNGTIAALDESNYEIKEGDVVICSGEHVECIGGVMGSKKSMIDENTTNVVVEAAVFNSIAIRKTSRRLQLFSDSSTRFVRGIDESNTQSSLRRVVALLMEIAHGKTVEKLVTFGEPRIHNQIIHLRQEKLNRALGVALQKDDIQMALDRLGFAYQIQGNTFVVKAPSYRRDLLIEEDLIEEVIRIVGFDHLSSTFPVAETIGGLNDIQIKRRIIRNHLSSNGLYEAYSYSLVDNKIIDDFCLLPANRGRQTSSLSSPMTEERAHMRKSLIPSLLQAVNYNQARKNSDVSFFELSKVYPLGEEHELLAFAFSGNVRSTLWRDAKKADYYVVKGAVESIFNLLGIEDKRYTLQRVENDNPFLHPGRSAYILEGKKVFGYVGQIHPDMEKKYDIKETFVAELDMDHILNLKVTKTNFAAPSIYPSIRRDIALVVQENIDAINILKTIKKVGREIIVASEVFDVYQGEHIATNHKSIAISIIYQNTQKTMTESEVNELHQRVLDELAKEYHAELRK